MKKCNICKVEKEISLFKKDNRRSDGYASSCKECLRIKGLEYYHRTKGERKEVINENRRKSYQLNKDVENERSREYKIKNDNKIKEYNKEYHLNNKEILSDKYKVYYKNNKLKINKRRKIYTNNKLKNDYFFKLKHYMRCIIRKSFKRNGYSKKSKTQEILGCSFDDFKSYLESMFENWMTWDNHGLYNGELNYGWDIDHIIPLSSAKTEDDIIKLNHYKNLKPLCSYLNRVVKRDNYIEKF